MMMVYLIEMNLNFFQVPLMELEVHRDSPILYPAQVRKVAVKHAVARVHGGGGDTDVSTPNEILPWASLPSVPSLSPLEETISSWQLFMSVKSPGQTLTN